LSIESPYPDYSVTQASPRGVITYYALAFGIAWLVWIPLVFLSRARLTIVIPESTVWLAGVAPIFAGSFMTYREVGLKGIKELIARCGMWKFGLRWYLITVLLPVVNILLDLLAYRVLGGRILGVPANQWLTGYLAILPFLIPLALFEEAGWRGYASPRLQYLLGSWKGSLVLGVLWGIWHIPYYLIRGVSILADFSLPYIILSLVFFVIGTTAFETLMTWVFRHTRGSLLFACIFHASNNAFANLSFVPTAKAEQGLIFVSSAVVCWIVVLVILRVEQRLQMVGRSANRTT
jgi:membrane protease YdiL (CAAX protease family)